MHNINLSVLVDTFWCSSISLIQIKLCVELIVLYSLHLSLWRLFLGCRIFLWLHWEVRKDSSWSWNHLLLCVLDCVILFFGFSIDLIHMLSLIYTHWGRHSEKILEIIPIKPCVQVDWRAIFRWCVTFPLLQMLKVETFKQNMARVIYFINIYYCESPYKTLVHSPRFSLCVLQTSLWYRNRMNSVKVYPFKSSPCLRTSWHKGILVCERQIWILTQK